MTDLQTFTANTVGRDFVVGDIHGCFHMLDALLTRIGFDRDLDRLFSVGDLIDRGPDSERAAEFLDAPWFFSIRGNHEQMLLDAVSEGRSPLRGSQARRLWEANGGSWFSQLSRGAQREMAERMATLPYAFEIQLGRGGIGVLVHADVLEDSWPVTRAVVEQPSSRNRRSALASLIWDRERASRLQRRLTGGSAAQVDVDGVDLIFFGHTPQTAPTACANTRWVDSGAFMGHTLSVAELATEGQVWSLEADLEDCRTGWRHC